MPLKLPLSLQVLPGEVVCVEATDLEMALGALDLSRFYSEHPMHTFPSMITIKHIDDIDLDDLGDPETWVHLDEECDDE